MTIETHPLTQMIQMYCNQYDDLRENNLDLQPMLFHKRHGLSVHAPLSWNILPPVDCVVSKIQIQKATAKVVVIFGSTEAYRKIYSVMQDRVQYFSWHEIFTGIHTTSTDVRYIQRSKQLLSDADVTFFIDPPSMPEVMDQVCGQTTNCLVVLSGGM
jgi:hypothetical protein